MESVQHFKNVLENVFPGIHTTMMGFSLCKETRCSVCISNMGKNGYKSSKTY